jgi:uncharacterized protein YggU (UPF0235/DUF167 family)
MPPELAARPVRLAVRVTPRAGRSEILGWSGDTLLVRVAAPPAGGAANAAVGELLARALGRGPSAVTILRGRNARTKLFLIAGVSAGEVRARLGGRG